jgi:acyl dehydratase
MASDQSKHDKLYLDDLTVGDEFRSGEYRIDGEQIKAFALQFDPQPFHLDAVVASKSFLQGLAASGWHTAAITMRLLAESVPLAEGLIGAGSGYPAGRYPACADDGDSHRAVTLPARTRHRHHSGRDQEPAWRCSAAHPRTPGGLPSTVTVTPAAEGGGVERTSITSEPDYAGLKARVTFVVVRKISLPHAH